MAECKECLHYGVCAKEGRLVQVDEHTWDEYNLLPNVEQFCTSYFTADVVPKSEVESINPIQEATEQKKKEDKENALGVLNELLDEKDAEIKRLKTENEALQGNLVIWKQNRFNLYQRLELYKMAQEKVAREIFEEIDELLVQNATMQIATSTLHCKLAELKNKYTESESIPNNNTKN